MSISILPSYLVNQDILVNLQIEDVLSFFEAFDGNFKYFHIEDKKKKFLIIFSGILVQVGITKVIYRLW